MTQADVLDRDRRRRSTPARRDRTTIRSTRELQELALAAAGRRAGAHAASSASDLDGRVETRLPEAAPARGAPWWRRCAEPAAAARADRGGCAVIALAAGGSSGRTRRRRAAAGLGALATAIARSEAAAPSPIRRRLGRARHQRTAESAQERRRRDRPPRRSRRRRRLRARARAISKIERSVGAGAR